MIYERVELNIGRLKITSESSILIEASKFRGISNTKIKELYISVEHKHKHSQCRIGPVSMDHCIRVSGYQGIKLDEKRMLESGWDR